MNRQQKDVRQCTKFMEREKPKNIQSMSQNGQIYKREHEQLEDYNKPKSYKQVINIETSQQLYWDLARRFIFAIIHPTLH